LRNRDPILLHALAKRARRRACATPPGASASGAGAFDFNRYLLSSAAPSILRSRSLARAPKAITSAIAPVFPSGLDKGAAQLRSCSGSRSAVCITIERARNFAQLDDRGAGGCALVRPVDLQLAQSRCVSAS
jgi:hypothetical protein